MKYLFVNSVCGIRSTGRICTDLADELEAQGHTVKIAYGRENVPEQYRKYAVRIGTDAGVYLNAVKARLLDNEGLNAKQATRAFLLWAEKYDPDVLWLHNLHGYYLNYELLFAWIKSRPRMKVKWTLHDCWAFTGHCSHFTFVGCDLWKTGCRNCPQKKDYPVSVLFSNAGENYQRKKKAFTGVHDLQVITPSQWLAGISGESFLGGYPVQTVNNTIDRSVFRPIETDWKKRHGIRGKMVLGVASTWNERKGMEDFFRLAAERKDVTVVLVGLSERQLASLPDGIIGIARTNNAQELVELYSAADVFFLPSKEENYPTVCLEAEACGTRVVVYDVGGCRETLTREDSAAVDGYETAVQII